MGFCPTLGTLLCCYSACCRRWVIAWRRTSRRAGSWGSWGCSCKPNEELSPDCHPPRTRLGRCLPYPGCWLVHPEETLRVGLGAWLSVERSLLRQPGCWGRWDESKSPTYFMQGLWAGRWGFGSAQHCFKIWYHRPGHHSRARAVLPPSGLPYACDQVEWV